MIDLVATEGHFVDHLAPVWRALPDEVRGTAFVARDCLDRATAAGMANLASLDRPAPTSPRVLTAAYGDAKRARALGYAEQAFVEHGIGQSYAGTRGEAATNGSYPGGHDRDDTRLFLVPNETAAARWRAARPDARVEVVGCPKLDTLPRRSPGDGPVVAVTFHWPVAVVPETMPAWADFGRGVLPAIARRFRLIGHAHPRFPELALHYRRVGIPFVSDFAEVCRQADVLLFDNTSAGFEFAATGRPVVVLNGRGYRRNVEHGLRFWEAASVGPQVDAPENENGTAELVIAAIERALALDPADVAAREAALAVVYAHRTGAADRAAAALTEWAA